MSAEGFGMHFSSYRGRHCHQWTQTFVREASPKHDARAVLDRGGKAGDVKFLRGRPPNTMVAITLELREGGFVAPEDTSPLVHSPMAMLECPCETVGHVGGVEDWLFACNARVKAGLMERLTDGIGT